MPLFRFFVINSIRKKIFSSNQFDFESNLFKNNSLKLKVAKVSGKFPQVQCFLKSLPQSVHFLINI